MTDAAVPAWLKELRHYYDLRNRPSLRHIADKAGISRATVADVLAGKRKKPSTFSLNCIVDAICAPDRDGGQRIMQAFIASQPAFYDRPMNTTTPASRARIAYTAYGERTQYRNFQGDVMPAFEDLAPAQRAGWEAAAQAIWNLATTGKTEPVSTDSASDPSGAER